MAPINFTTADLIWNRACSKTAELRLAGDRALASLLLFHGYAMNGGFLHAIECCEPEELTEAEAGYRFFGLIDVADMLRATKPLLGSDDALELLEFQLDERYAALVPGDSVLV